MVTVWPPAVNVPLRLCALGLAVTDQVTVLPLMPTEIQDVTLFTAAVGQSLGTGVTLMLPEPAPAPLFTDVGVSVYTHVPPVCATVTVSPATVSVPLRAWKLELPSTDQLAVMLLTETDAHATFEAAVTVPEQPDGVVIVMAPDAPPEPTFNAVGLTVYGHRPVCNFSTKPS